MKKTLKIVGIVISIPLVLFLVAAIVLASIDLNDYRSNIEQLVADNTGRQLTLTGELEKSFFPWLGVNVGAVSLSNAKGFQPAAFASVDNVEVKIDTVSLLTLKPKISRIIVKGLNLNLAKNKDGVSNWEDLSKPGPVDGQQQAETIPSEEKKQAAPVPADATAPLALINIAGVTIENANVNWVDEQAGASYAVSKLNLSVSEVELNKPIDLELDFELASSSPDVKAKVSLSSEKIQWDVQNQRYAVAPLVLNVKATGGVLPVSPLAARLSTTANVDLNEQTLNVSKLKLDTLDVGVKATASVSKLIDAPQYQSKIEIAKMNPRDLLKKLAVELPPMADQNVLSGLSFNAAIKGTTNRVDVSDLKLVLDDTGITGGATVNNFSNPELKASLAIDKIDLDRYLPPTPKEDTAVKQEQPAAKPEESAPQPLPVPVDLIRGLNVDADLKVAKLIVKKLDIDDVLVKARVKNKVATLSPVSLKLSGGEIRIDVTLDVTTDNPVFKVKQSIQQVQAAPLTKAVAGDDYVGGILDLSAAINSQGVMLADIKKNLNGNLSFDFKDGAVKGFNLGEELRILKAKLDKEDYKPSEVPKKTDFARLNGTATINNGVVTNNDLSAMSPLLRVEGKGKVDLVAENLNYLVTTHIVGSSKGQGGKSIDELKGIPIPIQLTGPFTDIQWDYKWSIIRNALQAKLKKQVKQKVEEKKEEIKQETKQKIEEKKEEKKEELKEKAKEKLKKLFKF